MKVKFKKGLEYRLYTHVNVDDHTEDVCVFESRFPLFNKKTKTHLNYILNAAWDHAKKENPLLFKQELDDLYGNLLEGRLNGEVYHVNFDSAGSCGCVFGSLAETNNLSSADYLPFFDPQKHGYAVNQFEQVFYAARPGDTPETHDIMYCTLQYLRDYAQKWTKRYGNKYKMNLDYGTPKPLFKDKVYLDGKYLGYCMAFIPRHADLSSDHPILDMLEEAYPKFCHSRRGVEHRARTGPRLIFWDGSHVQVVSAEGDFKIENKNVL